ncbi:unnamed protein product [Darwinula stevensoni]|uniref:Uncharacterized protein n=1 Tax=Darwinula stevensoni TaxID=69355 RepID=A0A7R8X7F1_9CRUS|nr:unnamed protein product [Darwinula stevensoni]CAG0889049.1 unnamed protein product [Darwinula stevensoni]
MRDSVIPGEMELQNFWSHSVLREEEIRAIEVRKGGGIPGHPRASIRVASRRPSVCGRSPRTPASVFTNVFRLGFSTSRGKPVVMSLPHFYVPDEGGDNGLNKSLIDGIAPHKDSHETFIDIEPTTGLLIRSSKKLQTNVKVRKIEGYKTFENFPNMVFPVFWVDEVSAKQTESSRFYSGAV